jgi:hypothetical protein
MNPTPSTKCASRGWFHPLRWRFWFVTMPVLFWGALAILFWWPGLSYNWSAGNCFYLYRHHLDNPTPRDIASMAIGSIVLVKLQGDPRSPSRGFSTEPGAVVFTWDNGLIGVFH